MAKTQAQWRAILGTFLPRWYFEDLRLQDAHMNALAKVLETLEADAKLNLDQTFILKATDIFLIAHGLERGIKKRSGELDPVYAKRVQNLVNQSNCPALEKIVNEILLEGAAIVFDNQDGGLFLDRDIFCDRDDIIIEPLYNVFTIITPPQFNDISTFSGDTGDDDTFENFVDRDDFIGSKVRTDANYDDIIAAFDEFKALGTLYRIIELS